MKNNYCIDCGTIMVNTKSNEWKCPKCKYTDYFGEKPQNRFLRKYDEMITKMMKDW